MQKPYLAVLLTVSLALILCSCGADSADIHGKIHSKFYTMPSYTAQCDAVVKSNKNENTYHFTCDYDSASNTHEIDYPDASVTLTNGKARIVRGDLINEIPTDDSDMLILLDTFFASYYESENTSMTVGAMSAESSGTTVLDCELTKPTKYGRTMKLTIQNKGIVPKELCTYDADGNEIIKVIFKSFETK